MEQVYFLCGNFEKKCFIYAIKWHESDWYYFEEEDSAYDSDPSLPPYLEDQIMRLKKVGPIAVTLNFDEPIKYVNDGKFYFKGKELKTFVQLSGRQQNPLDRQSSKKNLRSKSTEDLVFAVGKTNPLNFLKEFEKCCDIKTDKDKLYKIRNFVNQIDKPEFSTLYFKSDWHTARSTFLRKYSFSFTENKKRELCFEFDEETSLKSFVDRKMKAMSHYTTLSLENQLEMILSELPNKVSNLFIVRDKVNSTKAEILDFCDLIQEYCEGKNGIAATTSAANSDGQNHIVQDLEVFTYEGEIESYVEISSSSSQGSGDGVMKKLRGASRLAKIPKTIHEDLESSDSNSSQTTTSSYFTRHF